MLFQTSSSCLSLPQLNPGRCSSQRSLIGPVINWPAESDSAWTFSKWICGNSREMSVIRLEGHGRSVTTQIQSDIGLIVLLLMLMSCNIGSGYERLNHKQLLECDLTKTTSRTTTIGTPWLDPVTCEPAHGRGDHSWRHDDKLVRITRAVLPVCRQEKTFIA